jgi:hypothetical protein
MVHASLFNDLSLYIVWFQVTISFSVVTSLLSLVSAMVSLYI